MPKMKTHSSSKKRFKVTATGRVKRTMMGKNHILTKKSTKRKRTLRKGNYVDETVEATVKKMLPYA